MRARKDPTVRPARRQVTFAWPVAAAATLFALVALRWPRAPLAPARANPAQHAPPAMAFVEIPPGEKGFAAPRDFTRGLLETWPRAMEMEPAAQPPPPPIPFREWPADNAFPAGVPAE